MFKILLKTLCKKLSNDCLTFLLLKCVYKITNQEKNYKHYHLLQKNCINIYKRWTYFWIAIYSFFFFNRDIGPAVRVFANGPGDLGSIPGRVIPKTLKMVLDTTLLNTQHYKVRFKGKVEQSWEWSSALPYTLV